MMKHSIWLRVLVAVIGTVVGYFGWRIMAAPAPTAAQLTLPAMQPSMPTSWLAGDAASSISVNLPASLQGTTIPTLLKEDAHQHLQKTSDVRDFFDFLLIAQNELPAEQLNAFALQQITAQLTSAAAIQEALDLWRRYQNYRAALGQQSNHSSASGAVDEMLTTFNQEQALQQQYLSDVAEVWFAQENKENQTALERFKIGADTTLSEAEKKQRLLALGPPQKSQPVELSPEATERIQQARQAEEAWQAQYADYAGQRTQIETTAGLSNDEKALQIQQLRRRFFSSEAEAARALAFDRIYKNRN
ncbi:MAG: Lipase chaperone LimK [Glomeribacter sp. 1016415]|nr:Lipase chaperone LimK [Glomeribacter sp. 1016415]